jgi:hypothetical protein
VNLIYSAQKFGPSAAILRAFSPALVLVFIDMMFGTAILATGRAVHLAGAKVISVAVTTVLEIVLVPLCQSRFDNGGVGVPLSSVGGELVMIAATIYLLPRGTLDGSIALDLTRALMAGAGTFLIMQPFGRVTPLVGIPACVLVFALLSFAVGLISRADLRIMTRLLRRSSTRHTHESDRSQTD